MTAATLDHRDLLDPLDQEVCPDSKARREREELTASLVQLDHLVHLDDVDCLACRVFLDPRATEVFLDWMAPRVRVEDLE